MPEFTLEDPGSLQDLFTLASRHPVRSIFIEAGRLLWRDADVATEGCLFQSLNLQPVLPIDAGMYIGRIHIGRLFGPAAAIHAIQRWNPAESVADPVSNYLRLGLPMTEERIGWFICHHVLATSAGLAMQTGDMIVLEQLDMYLHRGPQQCDPFQDAAVDSTPE